VLQLAMFLRQKGQRQQHTTDITVLALATLGNAMQIEMILSVSRNAVADVFAYKHCQCTQALTDAAMTLKTLQ
jgi:hypothetical protein